MARILIVDDEPGIRAFLEGALTDTGHEVVTAEDGSAAIRSCMVGEFDLMMVDVRMPGALDGIDVLRHVGGEWPRMPVIVLTANGSVRTAVEAMHLGAADFLEKPVNSPAELRRVVARVLALRRDDAERSGTDRTAPASALPGSDSDHDDSNAQTTSAGRFLCELKRRRVYKVAVTYLAAGFLGLEATDLLLPALPLPGWTYSAIVSLVILCFPVSLVLAWIFDLTLTRTEPQPQSGTGPADSAAPPFPMDRSQRFAGYRRRLTGRAPRLAATGAVPSHG